MRLLCNVNIVRTASTLRQIFAHKPRIIGRVTCLTEPCTQFQQFSTSRCHLCNTYVDEKSLKLSMDQLGNKFSEARELLQDARESKDTVYFSDDMQEAVEAVTETIKEYEGLLESLNEAQKHQVIKTIGLRMEELKAQQQAIEDSLKDEH